MKKISIITVNYNQAEATEELLQSIIELSSYPLLEVVIVDNASNEDKVAEWQNAYPNFFFIRSSENLGFAGGNNLGIKKSSGEYIFLINNDTIITLGLIDKLAAFLNRNPDYAVVSPIINYYTPNTILQYAGFTKMNFITARNKCIGQYEANRGQYNAAEKTTWYAHGAAMMLRREAVNNVGLMPEAYFLYYEEMDWCEMFRRAGYKIGLCTDALIYHKESVSTGKNSPLKSYYLNRNRLLFVRRNANTIQAIIFFCYFGTVVHARFIVDCFASRQLRQIPLFTKALTWNIRSFFNAKNVST